MTELEVKLIKLDGGTQARAGTDRDTVNEYVEALRESDSTWPFPAVVVYHDGDAYWLADGFHRITAARQHGRFVCEADIRQGTQRDAILHAAGANADHGLRRTAEDKRRAVLRLLEDAEWGKWSDREIARRCRVSPTFVGSIRKELPDTVHVDSERVYTRNGSEQVMDTAAIGGKPKPGTADMRKRLRQSLRGKMYATYQVTGITDAELRQVLSRDWGLGGGSSGPEMTAVYKKGGANPGFWYNNYRDSGKPTLSGRELITWVREVLELPYPQKETAVSPPASPMSAIMADVDAYEADTAQLFTPVPAPRRADYTDPRLADLNTAIGIVTRLTADTSLIIDTVGPLARALGLMEDAKKALANRQAYAAWLRDYQDDDGRRWTDLSDNQTWHKNSPCYQAFVKAFPKEDFARSALMDAKQRLEQEAAVSQEVSA